MASIPDLGELGLSDLDKVDPRIRQLAREVDNISVPVQYRAPMAELAVLAQALLAELRAAQRG